MSFRDLVSRIRDLERSHGFVPDSFLSSLRGITVFDINHAVAVGGDSIADAIFSFRARLFDLLSPTPDLSRAGDTIINHLCLLLGVAVLFPASLVGSADARSLREGGLIASSLPSSVTSLSSWSRACVGWCCF